MFTRLNPAGAPKPASAYSQVVVVPAGGRRVVVSGQIGVTPEGQVRDGLEAQTEQCFSNLLACLAAAGAGAEHVVKITIFMVAPGDVALSRTYRDRFLPGVRPASTYLVVAGLASPALLVEVEAEAVVP